MGANAQTTVPTFVDGQVLTAAQQNQSARTGVPVFADTTARDAAFGGAGEKTLAEGQLCYVENLTGVAQIQYYDGAAWVSLIASGLVQVETTAKTDTFTASVAQGVKTAITGLSVSITPTLAANNVLILAQITYGITTGSLGGVGTMFTLKRSTTEIGIGAAASNRQRVTTGGIGASGAESKESLCSASIMFLDTPNTTSATTYSIDISHNAASTQTVYINRAQVDTDANYIGRGICTITAFEVLP